MDRMSTKELKQLRNLYSQTTLSCSKKLKWIQTLDTILSTVKITWNKIIILDRDQRSSTVLGRSKLERSNGYKQLIISLKKTNPSRWQSHTIILLVSS